MVKEENYFGHTPLHLAADKPACLEHLIRAARAADSTLLDKRDFSQTTPLMAALRLTRSRCRVKKGNRKCRRCTCSACVIMLLEADCAVPKIETYVSGAASRSAIRRYVHHLKDRRQRLKEFALDSQLPDIMVERLRLRSEVVLDAAAPIVVQLLKQRGVQIPSALVVGGPMAFGETAAWTVYDRINDPSVAEIFYRAGFRDTDVWTASNERTSMLYLKWLSDHGYDPLFSEIQSFEPGRALYTAHRTFGNMGYVTPYPKAFPWCESNPVLQNWTRELFTQVARTDLRDDCSCGCSPGGCSPLSSMLHSMAETTPMAWLIKGHFVSEYIRGMLQQLESFETGLGIKLNSMFLRYITFEALDIPHTCCRSPFRRRETDSDGIPDWIELEDEYKHELAFLNELILEFEGKLDEIL